MSSFNSLQRRAFFREASRTDGLHMLTEKGSLVSGPVEWTLTVDELFNNDVS